MIDQDSVERAAERFKAPDGALERLIRRRDRKRRNQRIAAGVVGLAVFVSAVWIVTSVGRLDRSETAIAPGPVETGPVGRPAPPLVHASAAPDVVRTGACGGSASSRMELTFTGEGYWEEVRFEVHRSPVGHSWHIVFRRDSPWPTSHILGHPFFRGTRVASDSGDLVVQRLYWDVGSSLFRARAVDTQTGQVCKAQAVS